MADACAVIRVAMKRNGWKGLGRAGYLNAARPSVMEVEGYTAANVTWTDGFVEDVSRTLDACLIFVFFPIYSLSDGGIGSVLTNQAGSMTKKGVPDDLLSNFNALSIIIMSPILSYIMYPTLRRFRIEMGPIKKICLGFSLGAISSMISAIVQWKIYQTSPCGHFASTCEQVAPVSLWWQAPSYWIGGTSELFANTTSYELAYALSPHHMKGLVMAVCLFMQAISAAISEACTAALVDPYLIWALAAPAVATAVVIPPMWFMFRKVEKQEFLRSESPEEERGASQQNASSSDELEPGKEFAINTFSGRN